MERALEGAYNKLPLMGRVRACSVHEWGARGGQHSARSPHPPAPHLRSAIRTISYNYTSGAFLGSWGRCLVVQGVARCCRCPCALSGAPFPVLARTRLLHTLCIPTTPPALTWRAAVVDGEIKNISLADYAGKYVILFW